MMTKQAGFQKDLTKKDLIKILEKIDSERTRQSLKEYSSISESAQFQNTARTLIGGESSGPGESVQAFYSR
jgi:hypothetical protein